MMRTTLNLPDDVTAILRAVAEAKGLSLGDAAAELIRRGIRPAVEIRDDMGVPCFFVASDAPLITLEHTLAIEDEL